MYLSEILISILHGFCLHGSPSSWMGKETVEVNVILDPYEMKKKVEIRIFRRLQNYNYLIALNNENMKHTEIESY